MFSKSLIATFIAILIGVLAIAMHFLKSPQIISQEPSLEGAHYQVGILQLIDHPAIDATATGAMTFLNKELPGIQIMRESAQGDVFLAQQIIQKLAQQNIDIFITIGTTATQITMQKIKDKPIIFASVTNPLSSGIVENLDAPTSNVTGVSNLSPAITLKQIAFIKRILPNVRKIGVIYNSSESNSIVLIEKIKKVAGDYSIEIKEGIAQNTNDAVFATKALLNDVDAIFIDNDNTALGAIRGIIDVAMKSNVPVFSSDIDTVKLGVLGAVGPDQYAIGEQVGKMVLDVLQNHKEISLIPVTFPDQDLYVMNGTTAAKLQIPVINDDNVKIIN